MTIAITSESGEVVGNRQFCASSFAHCLTRRGDGRCADRALERPGTNVIDLFLHCARQRNHLTGGQEEILLGNLMVLQPRLGQRRYDRLLDLGAGPAFHERPPIVPD